MAIIAKRGGEGKAFEPVSEGLHPANCWAVVDLGIQQKGGQYPGEKHEVYLGFEVLDQSIEFEKDNVKQTGPMRIGITLTNSLGEKAKLRRYLEKWRGRPFTEEELDGFDVSKLAGLPCQLLVTHTTKGDKTYANIDAVLGWAKGQPKPEAPASVMVFDLSNADSHAFAALPQWLQEKVDARLANNWDALNKKPGADHDAPSDTFTDDIQSFDSDLPF